jgi:hypothetical protein
VKCDRQQPCGACVKHNVDCLFNPIQPPRKRHKRVKVNALTEKLKQYEKLLQERGIDPGRPPKSPTISPDQETGIITHWKELQLRTPSSIEPETIRDSNASAAHSAASFQFVENSLWKRVVDESHADDMLEESSDLSDEEALNDDNGFVFGYRSRPRHPPPERIHQLWEIFVTNVDPLTKIVHVGTLRPAIHKAARNPDAIPRALEALMFAIYGCAVMSLGDEECRQCFAETRGRLFRRYVFATEAALSRAKFMGTASLVVLQAVVLHLLMVRDIYTPRTNWTLTGMAVRIAQVMGLERDGTHLGLSPFETEIRRRVWWQIKLHDFRTAEFCGLAKFRDMDIGGEQSTRWPTNVNDDQLFPGMSAPPVESDGLTDFAFFAARCEMSKFAAGRVATFRQQGKDVSQMNLDKSGNNKEEKRAVVNKLQELIETKYLRYCDPSQPLHLVTMLVARYGLNVVRFLTNHPRGWGSIEQTPLEERQTVWEVSLKLLEQHNMVQSNPFIKQFAWNAPYFRQWHAFLHVLDVLRAEPLKADAEKAWRLVSETYDNTPDMITNMRKPIHAAVGNLCMKGYDEREAALGSRNMYIPPTPNFILQLRQKRETAKARRETPLAKNVQPKKAGGLNDVNEELGRDEVSSHPESSMDQMQDLTINPPYPMSTELVSFQDPFDFFHEFDDGNLGIEMDDLDLLLAQDYNMKGSSEPMDWRQWDAWLADAN